MAHSRGSSILGFPEAYPIGLSMLIQARHPMTFVPRWVPLNRRPAMDTWRWEAGKCFDPKDGTNDVHQFGIISRMEKYGKS